jgi:copper chaperone CopZ
MKPAKETRLKVRGMSCGSCVKHVTRALEGLAGVDSVQVSLEEGEARVVHDPTAADEAQFIQALSEEGYEAEKLR